MPSFFAEFLSSFRTIAEQLFNNIQAEDIPASEPVKDYVKSISCPQFLAVVEPSLVEPVVEALYKGLITGDWSHIDRKYELERLSVRRQGVYAGVLNSLNSFSETKTQMYVGCSYGQYGLEHRVMDQHLNETHRKTQPTSPFYKQIAKCEAPPLFLAISIITTEDLLLAPPILLLESIVQRLFVTRNISPSPSPSLSAVSIGALNRSEPVNEGISSLFGYDSARFFRINRLHHMKHSRPWQLVPKYQKAYGNTKARYQVGLKLFEFDINIQASLYNPFGLVEDALKDVHIGVHWETNVAFENRYPQASTQADDGCHVGIKLIKTVNGEQKEAYVKTGPKALVAVKEANTIYDLLTDRINLHDDYQPAEERKQIFRKKSNEQLNLERERRQKRRVPEPTNSEV